MNENAQLPATGPGPADIPDFGAKVSGTDWDKPQTHLEVVLQAGQDDPELTGVVISTFLSSEVLFLSREQVDEESTNVQPLLLQNADGEPVIALFTHAARIPSAYMEEAPYAVRVPGAAVIDTLEGAGLVINPGHELGFEIGAEGVAAIRRDFNADGTLRDTAPQA